jgi:hypothetical protein
MTRMEPSQWRADWVRLLGVFEMEVLSPYPPYRGAAQSSKGLIVLHCVTAHPNRKSQAVQWEKHEDDCVEIQGLNV